MVVSVVPLHDAVTRLGNVADQFAVVVVSHVAVPPIQ
jgi:hypothetical protein